MVLASIKSMAISAIVHLATMVYAVKSRQTIAVARHAFQANVSHNDHLAISAYVHLAELVYNVKYELMSAVRIRAETMAYVLN
jgi:hypothetical protein